MTGVTQLTLLPALVSLGIAFLITPIVIKLAYFIGIVDDPKKNKHPKVIHTYPVPRGGGLAVYVAFFVTTIFFLPLDQHTQGILLGATVLVLLGLLDDKYNLSPHLRLAIQFGAAAIPIIFGIGISFVTNPLGGMVDLSHPQITFFLLGETRSIWLLSDLFAVFWIVFMMNILNMGAKGIDGQLPGVVVIAALTIMALSLKYSADIAQWPVIILASIVFGSFLGFLPWNFYPQKIMPSFGGSTLAGYLLALLAILSTTKVGTLMVVLGIPLIDTGYTIVRRILSGKSPFWGDRGHLHHKLLDKGLTKTQVTLLYWTFTAILGFIALNLNSRLKFYTIISVAVIIGGLLLWLTYSPQKAKKTTKV